jgi:hypothetical protein
MTLSSRPAGPGIDPARCPLCGQANACAMEAERLTGRVQPPCWCLSASFATGVLERIPDMARGAACICERCAAASSAPPVLD